MRKISWVVVALVAILFVGLVFIKLLSPTTNKVADSTNTVLGSTQTVGTYATGAGVTNMGGLFLWDTDTDSGLEVRGVSHLTGTTTLGYTPNQLNVVTTAFTSLSASTTAMNCVTTNNSGYTWVVQADGASLNFNAGGSANSTLTWGVTTTPSATAGTPSGVTNLLLIPTAFSTSSSKQVLSTSTAANNILVASGSSVVLSSSATSTANGNCVIPYYNF